MNVLQQWLAAPWVDPLGRTLLHFLWQGAALGALAWVALRLAHKRAARVRYGLAGALMLALAAMPVATFLILADAPTPAKTPMLASSIQLANKIAKTASVILAATGAGNPTTYSPPTPQLSPTANSAALIIPSNPAKRLSWLADLIAICSRWMVPFWVVGVLAMGGRLGLGWLRIQFWRRAAGVAADSALLASFNRLAEKFNVGARVRLLISKKIPGPVTLGWMRPAVLLPAQMLTGMPAELLEALLAHELAHIARRDYLANLVQSAIEIMLFYHPVVWWLGSQLREIREECCDELAVQACGDRLTYARALESLAELQLAAEPAAAASGGNLLARISRIVGRPMKAPTSSARHVAGILILAGFVIGLIVFLSPIHLQAQAQTPKVASAPAWKADPNTRKAEAEKTIDKLANGSDAPATADVVIPRYDPLVGQTSPLHYAAEPPSVINLAYRNGLFDAKRVAMSTQESSQLALSPPLPAYSLDAIKIADGAGLETAQFARFQYLIGTADHAYAEASVIKLGGKYMMGGESNVVENAGSVNAEFDIMNELGKIRQLPALQDGSYEVRLVPFGMLYANFLWLKSDTDGKDFLYPLSFAFDQSPPLALHTLYPAEEALQKLRPQVREKLNLDAEPQWSSDGLMNYYFVHRFEVTEMGISPDMRLTVSSAGATTAYSVEKVELIGISLHESPVAFTVKRHTEDTTDLQTRDLTDFEKKALGELRQGEETTAVVTKDGRFVVGAIRAQARCLRCHPGAQTRDVLGAFSYSLRLLPTLAATPPTP